ncbi:MAG: trypsin-like serine protease [Pirellulales bacterium]|nr:trypsin-like serine protease [Pirellulales bacterium]
MDRRFVAAVVLATSVVLCAAFARPVAAGTIRHDRDFDVSDESVFDYRALTESPRYACVGKVHGSETGSGTLIAPDWVLTAKHLMGSSASFEVNGATYSMAAGSAVKYEYEDAALFRLTQPVLDVEPAVLYPPALGSELGRVGTLVGFGRVGDGLTGQILPTGVKRAGQNAIDAYGSWIGWPDLLLLTDFDHPDGTTSRMGDTAPLELEICGALGDSGGGLFVDVAGQTYLAGVLAAMWSYDGADAKYGDGTASVRVTAMYDWILAALPAALPGDANRNGWVDARDAALLAAHWLTPSGAVWDEGDFNEDGQIDDLDLAILSANWGARAAAAVPEPAASLLLLTALAAACVPRRRSTARP